MNREVRSEPLLPPPPGAGAIDMDSHERPVEPPRRMKAPFTPDPKKHSSPDTQRELEQRKMTEATLEANRLFQHYLRTQAAYQQQQEDKTSPPLAEVHQALSDLWGHLHNSPVALTRKAQLIAILEPARKKLFSEENRAELTRSKQQEAFVRKTYLAFRRLQEQVRGANTEPRALFYPSDAVHTQQDLDLVSEYIHGPALIRPTRAEQEMDRLIRTQADDFFAEDRAIEARQLLFLQTEKVFARVRKEVEEVRRSLDEASAIRADQLNKRMHELLQEEVHAYDDARMRGERRGLRRASQEFRKEAFLNTAYKEALEAETAKDHITASQRLEETLSQLRPGDRTFIARVLRYRNEIYHPREQFVLGRHLDTEEAQTTPDKERRDHLKKRIEERAQRLETPAYYDKPLPHDVLNRVSVSAETLRERWSIFAANPPSPKTTTDLQPLLDSLYRQHGYALRLLEISGRLDANDPSIARSMASLEETIDYMRGVEVHYTMTVLASTKAEAVGIDTAILILETTQETGHGKELRVQKIQQTLASIEAKLTAFKNQFPPLARQVPYLELQKRFNDLCFRFETVSGATTPNTTARPPRYTPDNNPDTSTEENRADVRGRE